MNANITLTLDQRRPKKDGTCPIILRLSHKRKTTSIATGYCVPPKSWDADNRKIRSSYNGYTNLTRINTFLIKKQTDGLSVITKLEESKEIVGLSINELKAKILGHSSKMTFFTYTSKLIEDFIAVDRIGNARSYANVLREIKKFKNDVDFPFEELTYQFLKDLEKSYLSRGLAENGLAVYMRTIRAICNNAIKDGYVAKEHYPFENYVIRTKPTRKRAIRFQDVKRLIDLELEPTDNLFLARNIFLISFYLMGAPFIDLAFLKIENIKSGRIQYTRKKTGKQFDIKITEQLEGLLKYYIEGKSKSEFLLPIIKRNGLADQYKDIQWAQNRYNKKLKKLADLAGIEEHLTSYVSRHSFASLANNKEIPLTAISSMLGHQNIKTTQTYLAELSQDKIDGYNADILKG